MTAKTYPLMVFTYILATFFITTAAIADSEQCLKCHQDLIDTNATKLVIHRPFSQKHCDLCHCTITGPATPSTDSKDEWINDTNSKPSIEWLTESFDLNTLQVAVLPADHCDSDLIIKLWYQNRDKQQSTIHCPAPDTIPIRQRQKQQPTITQVRRNNYNDKLFTRATLSWTTNVPCRCKLRYNSDDHDYIEHEDGFYTVDHSQEIRNFNPANTQVSIQCDDTFQQHTQFQFTPITTLPIKTASPIESNSQEITKFTTDYKRVGDSIEIIISTSQPAAIALGRNEVTKQPPPVPLLKIPTLPGGAEHPPLTRQKQVNTTVCFQCHKETVEVASHPINVVAPPGMVIPPEYPLLSDGRMTCMTCHTPHSSNNEARLLKGGKKELCTGCHTNY